MYENGHIARPDARRLRFAGKAAASGFRCRAGADPFIGSVIHSRRVQVRAGTLARAAEISYARDNSRRPSPPLPRSKVRLIGIRIALGGASQRSAQFAFDARANEYGPRIQTRDLIVRKHY